MSEPGTGEGFQRTSKLTKEQPSSQESTSPQRPRLVGFNPWSALGFATLEEAQKATLADIKRAYRKVARESHPDTHKDDPIALERFARADEAIIVLSDDKKREAYKLGEPPYQYYSTPEDPQRGQRRYDQDQKDRAAYSSSQTDSETYAEADDYQDAGEETQETDETQPWWKSFGEYDEFDFTNLHNKTSKSGRTRMRRPHGKSEKRVRKQIDERAEREFNNAHEKAKRDFLKTDYNAYLTRWRELKHLYDGRKYFQKAKYGPFRQEAAANVTRDLETAIIDRLRDDAHYSIEPKIYGLPDGTYLRAASYWSENRNGREDITRIEHITGEKDEDGYYRSKGIEIVREGQSGDIWLRRVTRPYMTPNMVMPLQFYFDIGFSGGGYMPVVSEGAIKNKELKDYMTMLQQARPR